MGDVVSTLNDIELEMSSEEKNAIEDEQNCANRIFEKIDNEYFMKSKGIENFVSMYATGSDYDVIAELQYQKSIQKISKEEYEAIKKYHDCSNLYQGHLVWGLGNFYFMDNPNLSTKTLNGLIKDILISVDDKLYQDHFNAWKFPQNYGDVKICRNVRLAGHKVMEAETYYDSESTIYSQVNDSFLLATLKTNKDNPELHSIINTIQKKQINIRSMDADKSFIVQGCAGSGKTVVLLHRLRYLIFNEMITPSSYLYIVPNANMFDYVKDIAKKFKINTNAIKNHYNYYKFLLEANDKTEEHNELIFDADYLRDVYSEDLIRQSYELLFREIVNSIEEMLNYIDEYYIANKESIDNINDDSILAWKENSDRQKQIIISMQKAIEDDAIEYIEELEPCNLFLTEKTTHARKYLKTIIDISTKIKPIESSSLEKFKLLTFYSDNQFLAAVNRVLFSIMRGTIYDKFHKRPSKVYKHYWYLFTYARYLVRNNFNSVYKYIYIDEAQDFSLSELKLIYKINNVDTQPYFNLFGDINQTISSFGIKNWKELPKYLGSKEIIKLDENFRNTNQVVDYCNGTLPFHMTKVGLNMDMVDVFDNCQQFLQSVKTIDDIQFIVKDEEAKTDLIKELDDIENSIYTVKDAKGLEFKKIAVFDRDMTDEEKYIAYTRTLNKLTVVHELKRSNIKPEIIVDDGAEESDEKQSDLNEENNINSPGEKKSKSSNDKVVLRGNIEGEFKLIVVNSNNESEIINCDSFSILKNGKVRDDLYAYVDKINKIVYIDKKIKNKYAVLFGANKKLNVRKK